MSLPDWIPSPDRILELHRAAVSVQDAAGALHADRECVESALGAAGNGALYNSAEEQPDPVSVAAYALFYLATKQCFTDGTKRAAWLTAMEIIEVAGFAIACTDQQAIDLVLSVAKNEVVAADVESWLRGRLVAATAGDA